MNSPADVSPSPHRIDVWLLRLVVLLGLTIGFSLVADLILVAQCPQSLGFFDRVINGELSLTPLLGMAFDLPDLPDRVDLLTESNPFRHDGDPAFILILLAVVPFVLGFILWRIHTWRWAAGSALVLILLLAYLAVDDPTINVPANFEPLSSAFPGAEASYKVLMRYGKNQPLGRNFREPNRIFSDSRISAPFVDVDKPAAWPAWLRRHRSAIELDWADLAPVRAWVEELNRFDRIGDLTIARYDADIIAFGPLRSYSYHVCEMAGLQAIDGHGDEAIATVLPLLEVGRKLEPSSRYLVRAMIARVMQRMALHTAVFVLDTTPVSPAMRDRIAAALTLGIGGEAGARHLCAMDYTIEVGSSSDQSLGDFIPSKGSHTILRRVLNLIGPFVYNRRHSMNLLGEFTVKLQEAAARRDLAGIDRLQRTYAQEQARPRFKNFAGNYLVDRMTSLPTKMIETYWKIEDDRLALIRRLAIHGLSDKCFTGHQSTLVSLLAGISTPGTMPQGY
jgi:hypothetical protein